MQAFARAKKKTAIAIATALGIAASAAWAADPAKTAKFELPVGSPAPSFSLRSLDGTMVRLDEIAYSGKEKSWAKKRPLLLDFFRTDCGPCVASLPDLVEMYKELKPKGLDVVMVALLEPEEGREKLERFLAEKKLPFTVVVDETDHFAKKYLGAQVTLPATFLIDRNGVLQSSKYGAKGPLKAHFGGVIDKLLAGG